MTDAASWRADIDSLVFPIGGHGGLCAVHRRAFRTLLRQEPVRDDCMAYFNRFEAAFRAAATAKIALKDIPKDRNLHLTSRDIARKLVEMHPISQGDEQCPSP